jgi:hypothetical protein
MFGIMRVEGRTFSAAALSAVLAAILATGCSPKSEMADRPLKVQEQYACKVRIEQEPASKAVNWKPVPAGEFGDSMFFTYKVWIDDSVVRLVGYRPSVYWIHTEAGGSGDPTDRTDMVCLMLDLGLHRYVVLARDSSGLYLARYGSDQGATMEKGPQPLDVWLDFERRDPETAFWRVEPGKTYVEPDFYDFAKEKGVEFPSDFLCGPRDWIVCH